jgi:hypothetical protein
LRHNVIKTGLRNINTAYACISIADVCEKLRLEDTDDAEYIVAKAIRDGVIDAQLDHKVGVLRCNANPDVYVTAEPQELYHKRIQFCLNIRNEAIQVRRHAFAPFRIGHDDAWPESWLAVMLMRDYDAPRPCHTLMTQARRRRNLPVMTTLSRLPVLLAFLLRGELGSLICALCTMAEERLEQLKQEAELAQNIAEEEGDEF